MSAFEKIAASLAACGAIALACSPPNVANSDAAAACADYAYAYCSKLAQCSQTILQYRYPDESTCEKTVSAVCTNAVNAPNTGSSPSYEENCSQAVTKWDCVDLLDNLSNPPPECIAQAGLMPSGQPCGFAGQCQSGFCSIPLGALCGTCAPAPQEGDSCAALETCGRGLVCESSVCTKYALLGGACGPAPCTSGLACSDGTCQQPTETQGAACGGSDAMLCDFSKGLICNTNTGSPLCAQVQFVGFGAPCGNVDGVHYVCSSGSSCINGTCDSVSGVGGPCDLVAGPDCADGLYCITSGDGGTTGTCRVPDASACL